MREIKFRAWDQATGTMQTELGVLDWCTLNEQFTADEKLSFMQYTGLKDKNGDEIYEGDILATEQLSDMPGIDTWDLEVMGPVKWENRYHKWRGLPSDDDESIYAMEFVFVIGNIYENLDLLA